MMGQIFSRPLLISALAMTLGFGSGCAHWIELAALTEAAPPTSTTVATDARVPLLLETIRVTQNGSSVAPPANLERQVLGAIEATRLFSQHYQSGYTQPAADQARVTVRLSINNLVEPHRQPLARADTRLDGNQSLLRLVWSSEPAARSFGVQAIGDEWVAVSSWRVLQ